MARQPGPMLPWERQLDLFGGAPSVGCFAHMGFVPDRLPASSGTKEDELLVLDPPRILHAVVHLKLGEVKSLLLGRWCSGVDDVFGISFLPGTGPHGSWWAWRRRKQRTLKSYTFRWNEGRQRICWGDAYELNPLELQASPDCAVWHSVAGERAGPAFLWRRTASCGCARCQGTSP